MSSQLARLTRPFPDRFVRKNPNGYGDYVPHHTVVQALLATVGPFSFSVVQIIRGHVDEKTNKKTGEVFPSLHEAIVGVICRLTVTIDGREVSVEDAGDCEDPHNWPHDGARLKDACSDSLKRTAARIGCGTHLWAGADYFLHDSLNKRETDAKEAPNGS